MQNNCAVFRTGDVLKEGVDLLEETWKKRDDLHVSDRTMIWNSDLMETLELDNLLSQAMVTMASAANRRKVARCARPGGFSGSRRREMDEAHSRLVRRQRRR